MRDEAPTVFGHPEFDDHEEIVFAVDPKSGLRAIIAVHSTGLGPALGGCRMYPYPSEADAIRDALRLSRGMSYKAAVAGVQLGGGKCVIIGDPRRQKTDALLCAMGRAIDKLGGRYITGEDVGTSAADMSVIRKETRSVSCLPESDGGYGDPAPFTALGVFQAMRAALHAERGSDDLNDVTVAIQGVGNVGLNLCRLLIDAGAKTIVCDPYEKNLQQAVAIGAHAIEPEQIYEAVADIFSPCAVGAVLNDVTIPKLAATIVAGAANNQLDAPRHAAALEARGILYIPDYVANAGGLVCCAAEWYRTSREAVEAGVMRIRETSLDIVQKARREGITTAAAADEFAHRRLKRLEPKAPARMEHVE